MDCNSRRCDYDHFRREVNWVNWVRDREDSDVHLLITSDRTSGGGIRFTLDFIGRKDFSSVEKTLICITDPNNTDTEDRDQLTNYIALGLVQYIENSSDIASNLHITYKEAEIQPQTQEEDDPWKLWVYRIGVEGSLEGESQEKAYSMEGNANARRISEEFKIEIGVDLEYDQEEFEDLDEGETYINTSENYSAELLAVWSLSPNWSVGGLAEVSRSTYLNRDFALFAGPALEYNIYPYSESTRRAITFRYSLELASFDYELETIEKKFNETLGRHSLRISAAIQQPWGEIFGGIEGIQYLHDFSTHRINTRLNMEYRLFRGFNLDTFISFSRIKDQFYLPSVGLSSEEILLRRRQRETEFRYYMGLGISYRFGSKFANIVNPRID